MGEAMAESTIRARIIMDGESTGNWVVPVVEYRMEYVAPGGRRETSSVSVSEVVITRAEGNANANDNGHASAGANGR